MRNGNTDWDAKHYRKHASSQEKGALSLIDKIVFRGDESILDIGCGTGNVTRFLADKVSFGEVIGMDPSPKMIEQASLEFSSIPNLSFCQDRAESFCLDRKFDLITSFFALHWVKEQEKMLENVRAALKPGGKIYFLIVSGGDPRIGEIFQKDPWKSEIFNPYERFSNVTEEGYRELLNRQRFKIDCLQLVQEPYIFSTRDEMVQNFLTWVPFATGLSKERSLAFVEEIVDNIARFPNQQSNIETITSALYVEAHI